MKITTPINEIKGSLYYDKDKLVSDNYDYDIDVDALVLRKTDFDYAYSIEGTSEVRIDFDSKHNIIGIEVLDASRVLKETKTKLNNITNLRVDIIEKNKDIIVKFLYGGYLYEDVV